jgi:WD40-like Beta Propeller Repeat
MNIADIRSNLKALKRTLKGVPETSRIIAGVAQRNLFGQGRSLELGSEFPAPKRPYRSGQTLFDIDIVTPPDGHFMTTFFDVQPVSPSGRYLIVTKVPFINRIPYPGDKAYVCVVDLIGGTARIVYETRGWGSQLGANAQWSDTDKYVFCNDIIDGLATGVRINVDTLEVKTLGGPIFGTSPDRLYSYSGNLEVINAGIPGYGVPEGLMWKKRHAEKESQVEGIWKTNLLTGKRDLLISIRDIVEQLPEQDHLRGGTYYIFNVKVNPQNSKIMVVIFTRGAPKRAGWPVQLVTMDIDGKNIKLAIPDRLWRVGGHHPNWAPDGDHIVMNLREKGKAMAFVRFRHDGSEMEVLANGHKGGGHPSLNPSGSFLLTDAYTSEGLLDKNGDVPLRLIDLELNTEKEICRIFTNRIDGPRRVDPHPVWSADGKKIFFNGIVNGYRQVMSVNFAP